MCVLGLCALDSIDDDLLQVAPSEHALVDGVRKGFSVVAARMAELFRFTGSCQSFVNLSFRVRKTD